MSAVAWMAAHPAATLTVCAVLVVNALVVLLVQGAAKADRLELGERRAVPRDV